VAIKYLSVDTATGAESWIDVAPAVKIVRSFEALAAGDFVNLFLDGVSGVINARKAVAGASPYEAHGFVKVASLITAPATVYQLGANDAVVAAVTPNANYFLSATPGVAGAANTADANYVQWLGYGEGANDILFSPSLGVVVA
jgi:hypothetical protein